MTQKLFYENLYMTEFDATVIETEEKDGKTHILLDRTAFYPGGGGQPCDTGFLNGHPVEAAYEKNGDIFHVVDGVFSDAEIHGSIDWTRRFELMQMHLGQHILSAIFVRDYELNTIALRLEQNSSYIDLDGYANAEKIACAEFSANEAIYQNIPVEVLFPDMDEIRRNSKRAIPETDEPIRIIKIGDLDYTPCCGLQNKATGEVGLVKVLRVEKHKTGTRIHFLCGRPALRWINSICVNAMHIMNELNCSESELAERVLKLRNDVQQLKEHQKSLLSRLATSEASELLAKASHFGEIAVVKHIMQDTTQDEMKQIYAILTEQKGVVALLGGKTTAGVFLMFGCNKGEKRIDVREAFKNAIAMIGGKGGGGASYAQGVGQDDTQLSKAINAAADIINSALSDI